MQCCDGTSNEPLRRLITVTDCWILDDSQGQRWLKKKKNKTKKTEAPVAHYGRQRWQVRRASGRSIAIPLCLCAFNWAFGAGIINMQLQSPLGAHWRGAGVCVCVCVCVCLLGVCLCVWLITHLCPPSEPRPFSPFCAPGERGRREAHLHIRSQIIYLARRQRGRQGAREGKIAKKGGEGKKKKKKKWRRKGEKQTREWAVWTAK